MDDYAIRRANQESAGLIGIGLLRTWQILIKNRAAQFFGSKT